MKKFLIFVVLSLIVILTVFFNRSYILSNFLKYEYRYTLKKIFPLVSVSQHKIKLANSSKKIKLLQTEYLNLNFPRFVEGQTNNQSFSKDQILLSEFNLSSFKPLGSRAYITDYNNNIFMGKGDGTIFFIDTSNIVKLNEIFIKEIKSNLLDNFYKLQHNTYYDESFLKDILIYKNYLYISIVDKNKPYCYTNKIYRAKINDNFLNFENFFDIKECQPLNTLQTGGSLEILGNTILMSIGDYDSYIRDFPNKNPQDPKSLIGKIISININTKENKIISMGHRNPQGLYFDSISNKIYSTEHGPEGGDEINVIDLNLKNKKFNFGWGISSYGEHYGGKNDYNKRNYKMAPLEKSHRKYGFIEPIYYFTPSIGITEIIKLNDFFKNGSNNNLIIGSMGNDPEVGNSLYIIGVDEKDKIQNIDRIKEVGRVRSITYNKTKNAIFFYSEKNGGTLFFLRNSYN